MGGDISDDKNGSNQKQMDDVLRRMLKTPPKPHTHKPEKEHDEKERVNNDRKRRKPKKPI